MTPAADDAPASAGSRSALPVHLIRAAADLQSLPYAAPAWSDARLVKQLVESEIVSPAAIAEALEYRKAHHVDLIDAIEQVQATDKTLRPTLLASRLGIPMVHVESLSVEPRILNMIPADLAVKHRVFPLGEVRGTLVVAMIDPSNLEAIGALNFTLGRPFEIVMTTAEDIARLIDNHFLVLQEQNLITEFDNDQPEILQSHADAVIADIEQKARQKPVVRLVDTMLRRGVRLRASDINIRPNENGAEVYYRIDGKMVWQRMLAKDLVAPLVCRIKIMSGMNIAERRLPQDGHTSLLEAGQRIDMRVSVIPMVTGESVVIRVLDKSQGQIQLSQLGIAAEDLVRLNRILSHTWGIFLVTGPTGSGKSTTLYAILNERMKKNPHIITVEDPVEYRLNGVEQIQIKPGIGYTFAEALRHILRHDPDEILIGEMRDFETAEIAIKSALTGHFVLSTLHTNDAASAITRLQDMGLESYLISSTVIGIMAQRLVRRICKVCKTVDAGNEELRVYFGLGADEVVHRGAGCPQCFNTGYRGRAMVGELIEVSNTLRDLITAKAGAVQLREVAVSEGMIPLSQNALAMVRAGITTLDEAFAVKLE